jgi:hypothetical protein
MIPKEETPPLQSVSYVGQSINPRAPLGHKKTLSFALQGGKTQAWEMGRKEKPLRI